MSKTSREDYVTGLRELADALEKYQWMPLPSTGSEDWNALSLYFFTTDGKVDAKASLAAARKVLGGRWDKEATDSSFKLVTSEGIGICLSVNRELVCERVVTGTKTVKRAVYSEPVEYEDVEEEEVEWVCPPSLLGSSE